MISALLAGCGTSSSDAPVEPRIGSAALARRFSPRSIPPFGLEAGLPSLGSLRVASSTLNLFQAGTEALTQSGNLSWDSGDLVLDPAAGDWSYAVYGFNTEGRPQSGLAVEVADLGSMGYWVALANFGSGRWEVSGPYTQSASVSMAGGTYLNASQQAFAAVIAHSAAATVTSATLVVVGADAQNSWPAPDKPLRTAWLKQWYLPLPLLGGPDGVYQSTVEKAMADEVYALLNAERAANSLPPLARDEHLDAQSCGHCRDMAARMYFAHDSPEGMDPGERLEAMDPPTWTLWAENIAVGYPTPEDANAAWILSMGHHENMLLTDAEYVGIGVWRSRSGTMYWAHNFGAFETDPAAHDWIDPGEEKP